MDAAPDQERERRPVPEAAQEHRDHHVAVGLERSAAVAAAPTKEFDEKLGKGFFSAEQFVRFAYAGVLKHA